MRTIVILLLFSVSQPLFAVDLTIEDILNEKGNGKDNRGNTSDDTWQFWFELAHKPNHFATLDTFSTKIPKEGIPKKVRGPVASMLPNPNDTQGWIFHSDWDGRFEGVWADKKTKEILAFPYVEKQFHGAVAITYRIPEDGKYDITGGLSDLQVAPQAKQHDGIEWFLDLTDDGTKPGTRLAKGGPIGDGNGNPDSGKFEALKIEAKKGQLLRLVIHPRKWWGTDLTRIDRFRIESSATK